MLRQAYREGKENKKAHLISQTGFEYVEYIYSFTSDLSVRLLAVGIGTFSYSFFNIIREVVKASSGHYPLPFSISSR